MRVSVFIVAACMTTMCLCFSGSPASAAVEGWEDLVMIPPNLDYTQCESLGMDDQGNSMVVWEHPEGNTSDEPGIWARTYNRVLGWGEPEMIFDSDYWWGRTTMEMAPNGRAIAAWGLYSESTSSMEIYARFFDPVTRWGETMAVATDLASLGDTAVAINSQGNAVFAWGGLGPLHASIYDVGVGWGAPVQIDIDGSSPVTAIDELGNVLILWHDYDYRTVEAIRYVPGDGWSEIAIVSGAVGGYRMTMDMDGSGNAMAVWHIYDGTPYSMYAARYVAGEGWTEPVRIGPVEDGEYPYDMDVCSGPGGSYFVTWRQSNSQGISVWVRIWTPQNDWEDAVLVSGYGYTHGSGTWPRVSVNEVGQAVIVWTQGGTEPLLDVRMSRYEPSLGWSVPEVIDNSDTLNAWRGRAEIDPLGNIVATWRLDLGQCWLWGAVYKAYCAPDVMISEPLDGTVTTESPVTVRGYAETYADLTVNDVPIEIQADGSFEAQVALLPGDNTVLARATDEVGNFTETSITIRFVGGSSGDPVAVMEIISMTNWHIWRFDGRGSTDDGKIVEYLWDFGDGVTSESKVSSHRYEKAGKYIVMLTVWDDEGNSGCASTEILVKPGGM